MLEQNGTAVNTTGITIWRLDASPVTGNSGKMVVRELAVQSPEGNNCKNQKRRPLLSWGIYHDNKIYNNKILIELKLNAGLHIEWHEIEN